MSNYIMNALASEVFQPKMRLTRPTPVQLAPLKSGMAIAKDEDIKFLVLKKKWNDELVCTTTFSSSDKENVSLCENTYVSSAPSVCECDDVPKKVVEMKTYMQALVKDIQENTEDDEQDDEEIDVILECEDTHVHEDTHEDAYDERKYTQICKSVINREKCKYGNKCCFAHTIEQFKPIRCNFGSRCFHVCYQGDCKYSNTNEKQKICMCIHEDESKEEFIKRIGLKSREQLTGFGVSVPVVYAPVPEVNVWKKE